MKPKTCRRILNIIALVGLCVIFLANIPPLDSIRKEIVVGAAFLMIGDLVFGFIFLRCPHCKKLLNFRWSSQSICHNCGAKLDEDDSKS